ncbi:hypothetical protein CPAR01_03567 [Colletotrichum paranaense]|uniref:Uncharacterized protein n=5 Tax=Colletotrichum acutatum species complex TaxID=2707335 RepID=A0AAJ0DZW6_9PEZI|nr:uncharacterized protein CCOS01_08701 [Colletotrichum costaricense]XP_060352060.1 uncharacterized protein CPAR01_03567 [Colletotrichum paranaense]XP_060385407.1 uncharacterized protein CTAM01_03956 [Colletotrichum tamarilloi]XP_060398065.1 uncharacterized protein CABS01_01496 [Colletotrichum abscissum]KAI3530001.1 hypothetical protein CSPX01_15149 [Colletotrichum filicis]KAK1447963.1 hypothetical protein CCUS01_12038 [Colletotrichum cuscutae]KAK1469440.1 hypothetical protein CMEL01_01207 [C
MPFLPSTPEPKTHSFSSSCTPTGNGERKTCREGQGRIMGRQWDGPYPDRRLRGTTRLAQYRCFPGLWYCTHGLLPSLDH